MSVPDSADFDTGGALTYSFWYKTTTEQSNTALLAHDASQYKYVTLMEDSSDRLASYIRTSSGVTSCNDGGSGNYENGTWHHYATVYDRTLGSKRLKLYIDGIEKGSATGYDEDIASGDEGINIGSLGTGNYFTGNIDEVAIWNKALSAGDISALYSAKGTSNLNDDGNSANLKGWWRMGDGDTFPTITDNSTNSNDGTMTNMASDDIVKDTP